MKDIQAKDVMIPISRYVTIKKDSSLIDVLQALEENRSSKKEHAHRDAMVVDDAGNIIGKVTMIDIFSALEPNHKKVKSDAFESVLTEAFVQQAVRDFNLWMEPIHTICERGTKLMVTDVMHVPEKVEFIQETETLERALAEYVMGVHQPLIVKDGDKVTGVLRFGDVFEVVRESLLACKLEE